jgi:hypothetical protein
MKLKLEALKSHKDAAAALTAQVESGAARAAGLRQEIQALQVRTAHSTAHAREASAEAAAVAAATADKESLCVSQAIMSMAAWHISSCSNAHGGAMQSAALCLLQMRLLLPLPIMTN